MTTDRQWVIVRIDGKIAAISTDYKALAAVASRLAKETKPGHSLVTAETVPFDTVWELRCTARWEDFMLFGTDFQKKVWRKLYNLTHISDSGAENSAGATAETESGTASGGESDIKTANKSRPTAETQLPAGMLEQNTPAKPKLLSYSDFAELCENRSGVRAVAHAVGLNPLAVVIPCHLVVPKESIDRIRDIRKKAEDTIFKGDDLCLDKVLRDPAIDFGEYALGRKLKRELILKELL